MNIKLFISLSKVKDRESRESKYVESPKVMVNKCVVTNCSTGYNNWSKESLVLFLEDQELKRKWIYFVNCKDWLPTTHSVICKTWQLHPVPTTIMTQSPIHHF